MSLRGAISSGARRASRRPAGIAALAAAMTLGGASTVACSSDQAGNPSTGGSGATGAGGSGAAAGAGGGGATGAGGSGTGGGAAGGTPGDSLPGDKWIPSFVVKYGGATNLLSAEETANFDLIITGPGHSQAWTEGGHANSWETLRSYNPDIKIALYVLGPSEFNTSSWAVLGDRWDWVTANHGIGSVDPWIGHGYDNPDRYLYNDAYTNERIMDLGQPNWRQFFYTEVYDALWGSTNEQAGADGLFSDVTGYDVPYTGNWRVVDGPNVDAPDDPAQYYDGSNYDHALHRAQMNQFFDEALPWLSSQSPGFTFTANFTGLTDGDHWAELDARQHHPYAAMAEAGLLQPYGAYTFGVFNFQEKLDTTAALQNVKLIDMCHGKSGDLGGSGLAKMDSAGSTGPGTGATTMTGWEALWFSMCAHMAAINQQRNSALLGFTVWSYSEYHWFDELDPTFLHLGEPVGERFLSGEATMREFDDGWVACNGTTADLSGLAVPTGEARVIDHDNFKNPDSAPLVTSFDLPLHRGVVLLKDGRQIGN